MPDMQRSEGRIQQFVEANSGEMEHQRTVESMLENERIVNDALICRIRKQGKDCSRELIIGYIAGFCSAYALVEGLRWLLP